MASPKSNVFFLYDSTTGVPAAGVTPVFYSYQDTDGNPVADPTITDLGGGAYIFTPTFPTDKGIVFTVQATGFVPEYQSGFLRPEDYNVDLLTDLHEEHFGKWQIFTSGPDANRLVIYREDGITVLKKFDLFDGIGLPSTSNVYKREPVP